MYGDVQCLEVLLSEFSGVIVVDWIVKTKVRLFYVDTDP